MINIRTAFSEDLNRLADLWYEQMVIRSQAAGLSFDTNREDWLAKVSDWIMQKHYVIYAAEIEAEEEITGFVLGHVEANIGVVDEMILDAHRYYGGQGRLLYTTIRDWFDTQTVERVLVSVPRYHPVEQAFWRALGAVEWKDANCPPGMMFMTL